MDQCHWCAGRDVPMKPTKQFTNGIGAHNWNLEKTFCSNLTLIIMIQWDHDIAHLTTSQLSWYVHNCYLPWLVFFMQGQLYYIWITSSYIISVIDPSSHIELLLHTDMQTPLFLFAVVPSLFSVDSWGYPNCSGLSPWHVSQKMTPKGMNKVDLCQATTKCNIMKAIFLIYRILYKWRIVRAARIVSAANE